MTKTKKKKSHGNFIFKAEGVSVMTL